MNQQKVNEWSTVLCGCFEDCHSCCLTFWCPCITFGRIADIVNKGSPSCCSSATVCIFVGLSTTVCCSLIGLPIGGSCLYTCGYRSQLRNQYGLKKTPCDDCLVHWCCGSCALCQEYRELQNRGFDMSIGWRGNVARQTRGVAMAPVVEKGMTR